MATSRRTEWSASRPSGPPPSYGGPPPYEGSPYPPSHHRQHSYDSPYSHHHGPPPSQGHSPSYSYGRSYGGPPPSHSYEAPPPHYGYEREPPPGPPPRYHERGPYPPTPGYESYPPPSSPYASPPPAGPPPRVSAYSQRGRGIRYLTTRAPSSDSKSVSSSSTGTPARRVIPMHRQSLAKPASSAPAPWQPPPRKDERPASPAPEEEGAEKKDGDPLALLAKVSSDMDQSKSGGKKKDDDAPESPATPKTTPASMAPPTSPLARRGASHPGEEEVNHRSSPIITPNPSVTHVSWKRPRGADDYSATSSRRSAMSGPKPITPMPPHYMAGYDERGPPPPPHHSYGPPPPSSSHGPPYYSQGPPSGPPPGHHYGPPPPGYEANPPPPHHPGAYGGPYAYPHVVERHSFDSHESSSLTSQESWRRGPYPGPPPHGHYGGAPPPPEGWYPPPPTTPYPGREGPPGGPYVSPYGPPPPHHPPPMEEKTVLRKKFSWKHYPELERFLIANRDDYLEHSSKNYTAEQKQYNNWLTERLLEVADQHNYAFDPEDFNFVAIRDRIRCYYKSYVQTARKRGLELPGNAHLKRTKLSQPPDASEDKSEKPEVEKEESSQESKENQAKPPTEA